MMPNSADAGMPVNPIREKMKATTARTHARAAAPCALEREHKFIVTDTLLLEQANHHVEARSHAVLGIGVTRLFRAQCLVDRTDAIELRRLGLAPVGVIANDIAALVEGWRDVGEHPIVTAILRRIDDVGKDLLPRPQRVPQQLEDATRHVGVADQAVGRAHQLLVGIFRHPDEDVVGVGDPAFEISLRYDQLLLTEEIFYPSGTYRLHQFDPRIKASPATLRSTFNPCL